MHRLKQPRAIAAQGGRGQHADRAGEHGGFVAEDVAKQVAGEQHVELPRGAHQLHGGVIDIHVAHLHAAVIARHYIHPLPPELADIEHIGFVH